MYFTISEISGIFQNAKMSLDPEQISFRVVYHTCKHLYSLVSRSTPNLRCLASPISKICLGAIIYKKFFYCSGTARCTMLVNLCYVSRNMRVRKVSNSRRDLQGHSRSLALVLFDRPHTISYWCSVATVFLILHH